MISHQRSLRLWSIIIFLGLFLVSCSLRTRDDLEGKGQVATDSETGDVLEYSIKKDRSHLDGLRQDISEPVKQKNDELALVMDLMKDFKMHPSEVRGRFDKVVRKKRDQFNKDLRRERDDYNKNERKKRDAFLSHIKRRRNDFNQTKPDRDKRTAFNKDYQEKRDDFFNSARENRLEKESDWRERRRDFDAYLREKRSEFSDEVRSYTKKYYEYKKGIDLKNKMKRKESQLNRQKNLYSPGDMFSTVPRGQQAPAGQAPSNPSDFDQIYSKPAHVLQPGEDE